MRCRWRGCGRRRCGRVWRGRPGSSCWPRTKWDRRDRPPGRGVQVACQGLPGRRGAGPRDHDALTVVAGGEGLGDDLPILGGRSAEIDHGQQHAATLDCRDVGPRTAVSYSGPVVAGRARVDRLPTLLRDATLPTSAFGATRTLQCDPALVDEVYDATGASNPLPVGQARWLRCRPAALPQKSRKLLRVLGRGKPTSEQGSGGVNLDADRAQRLDVPAHQLGPLLADEI